MKICLILIAGLDNSLLSLAHAHNLPTLSSFKNRATLQPTTPAVTSTMQATLSTGRLPSEHGIIANGLFTHNRPDLHPHLDLSSFPTFRKQISFWEQANALVQAPRFWQPHRAAGKKVSMLFWQNSMPGTAFANVTPASRLPSDAVTQASRLPSDASADIILTPKPTHTPDGKTLTACWSHPADLYSQLTAKLGPFPLHHYWGPMASLPSSQWIISAAMDIWSAQSPDLQLVYIPHMDYNLQRHGPNHPSVAADLTALDAALAPLVALIRSTGGIPILAGDYGITPVSRCIAPNLHFRQAGLLQTTPDATGKLLINYETSAAVAMADHQIAHIYCPSTMNSLQAAVSLLRALPGIAQIASTPAEKSALGLNHPNSGDVIALAQPDAWFAHDWWLDDSEKPAWQFSVDIHRKPGYDPRELFFNPATRSIPQDPSIVKGSHGHLPASSQNWPALLSDLPLPAQSLNAIDLAPWLSSLL